MFNKLFNSNNNGSAASSSKSANQRDQALERARLEREQREVFRQKANYTKIMEKFLRSSSQRVQSLRYIMNDIEAKLNTINTLKVALNSKGVQNFVPPAAALHSLIVRYNLCNDRIIPLYGFYCQTQLFSSSSSSSTINSSSINNNTSPSLSTTYGRILIQLFRWINTSLLAIGSTSTTVSSSSIVSVPLFRSFVQKLLCIGKQFLLYRTSMPATERYELLDQLCILSGMHNPSSSLHPLVYDFQSSIRIYLWNHLRYTEQICRSILFFAREYEENENTLASLSSLSSSAKTVSMESEIGSKAFAFAFYLADTLNSSTQPSTYIAIVQHLLTVPWVYFRIQNSKQYSQCRSIEYLPKLLDNLTMLLHGRTTTTTASTTPASFNAIVVSSSSYGLYSIEQGLPPYRYLRKPKPLINKEPSTVPLSSVPSSSASSLSSSLSSSVASPSSSSLSSSSSSLTTGQPIHGWSTYAVPEKGKSFFDSDLAKLSLNPSHNSTNISASLSTTNSSSSSSGSTFSTGASSSFSYPVYLPYGMACWKPEAVLLGNLLSLLVDPLPTASNNAPAITSIDTLYVPIVLDIFAILIESLPDTIWNTSRPVQYISPSFLPPNRSSTNNNNSSNISTVPVPVLMPLPLILQLRKLSNEPFSRYVARVCTKMEKEKLSNPRLRLPIDDDPERTTYDSTSMDPRLGLGYNVNNIPGRSTLEATPSLTTSVLRSVWETSKLALSLFQRKKTSSSSLSTVGSATEGKTNTKPLIDESIRSLTLNSSSSSSTSATPFDNKAIYSFTRVYSYLCAPRPLRNSAGTTNQMNPLPPIIDNDPIINRTYLLSALAFSSDVSVLTNLWYFCVDQIDLPNFVKTLAFKSTATNHGVFGVITLLASLLAQVCLVIDDIELYDSSANSSFLPLRELRYTVRFLRDIIVHAEGIGVDTFNYPPAKQALTVPPVPYWYRFSTAAVSSLRSLYDRHTLRPLGPPDMFLIDVTKIQICLLLPSNDSSTLTSVSSPSSNPTVNATSSHPLSTSSVTRNRNNNNSSSSSNGVHRVGTGSRSQRNRGLFGWSNPFSNANEEDNDNGEDDDLNYGTNEETGPGTASTATVSESEIAIDRLLMVAPFTVPFNKRAERFELRRSRAWYQSQVGQPQVRVKISRNRIFESTYLSLRHLTGNDLRRKIAVIFYDMYGNPEMGLDAGGLFKELWTNLCSIIFNPNYGLWALTTNEHEFYPNPQAGLLLDSVTAAILADSSSLSSSPSFSSVVTEEMVYEFIGKIVGKALWEGITIGPQFARFFLHRFTGRGIQLHHLASFDYELYKSLMFLKTYEGDVSDLCLTFTMNIESIFDSNNNQPQEKELIPNGRNINVTNNNRLQYIYLVADARLNQAIAKQTNAFIDGLHSVVPSAWLNTFSPPELQVLISGSLGEIDIDDLKNCTVYSNGYTASDSFIVSFWSTVSTFTSAEKAAFLKFVTSCERAPSLGFKHLHPKFTIERVNIPKNERGENAPLPTASTCFHVLRLPTYSNSKILKDKLLLAISSGGNGFHLI